MSCTNNLFVANDYLRRCHAASAQELRGMLKCALDEIIEAGEDAALDSDQGKLTFQLSRLINLMLVNRHIDDDEITVARQLMERLIDAVCIRRICEHVDSKAGPCTQIASVRAICVDELRCIDHLPSANVRALAS